MNLNLDNSKRSKSTSKLIKEKEKVKEIEKEKDSKIEKNIVKDKFKEKSSENKIEKIFIENSKSKIANKFINEKEVDFSKKSNKQIIKNAIVNVCLAGITNSQVRTKVLEVIDSCKCENFIILFKDNVGRKDLKAVYTFNCDKIELLTYTKDSPLSIENEAVKCFYKYDTSKKEFKELKNLKKFCHIVDAVSLSNIV